MIKLILSILSTLSLLASGFLIWQSNVVRDNLPKTWEGLVSAYFGAFHDPVVSLVIYALTSIVVLGSWFITELILGWIFSLFAGLLALMCFLGFLSIHYPPIQNFLQALSK